MTLSPEERARSVVRSLLEPLDNGKPYLETPMRKIMGEVIATAIRDAENAKVDQIDRFLVRLEARLDERAVADNEPVNEVLSGGVAELRTRLSMFKHKD